MAEEQDEASKTEEPTSKRISDAMEKGQVPTSIEVTHAFMLTTGAVILLFLSGWVMKVTMAAAMPFIEAAHDIPADAGALHHILVDQALAMATALALPVALLVVAAVIAARVQHPITWAVEKMQPDLTKLSPIKGAKRMFGPRSLLELGKSILKFSILSPVIYLAAKPQFDQMELMVQMDPIQLIDEMWWLVLRVYAATLPIIIAIAALDYLYVHWEWHKALRMTKQEIKDEHKQQEGDPLVKSRLRRIRYERTKRRIMQAVPKADVVITNPTHFAVALQYQAEVMDAPIVVAKGVDELARRIREVADEHKVPIVENPPLARTLYDTVDIDEEIRPEQYKAVAEVISYIMRLRGQTPRAQAQEAS